MAPADPAYPADLPARSSSTASIRVELVYCAGPNACATLALRLPAGSALQGALATAAVQDWLADQGLAGQLPGSPAGQATEPAEMAIDALKIGIWGKVRDATTLLREGDRIEVYRPLRVDPKEARRQRYGRHKAALLARQQKNKPSAAV